jgi:hypothetical protein
VVERISKGTRSELIDALADRYRQAKKSEKSRILDELERLARCHRKHAIRLLKQAIASHDSTPASRRPGRRIYGEAVKEALIVLWEASDRLCAKRIKAALPTMVTAMERHGHLALDVGVRVSVMSVSAATIDRMLKPIREQAKPRRRRRRVASKPARRVPLKTFTDWVDSPPGALEIDMVAHCGGNMSGSFIHSLVATDVCTGWVEAVPLLAREQSVVVEGLKVLIERFPMATIGINSDNDSAFINDTLIEFCLAQGIEFTRARAYRKNDQAWIEQKNGAVIRGLLGYDRYSGVVAGQAMAQLYAAARLYVNFFQPSFKLRNKTRTGARVTKTYDAPVTPFERLLAHDGVDARIKEQLRERQLTLDPLALLQHVRAAQSALAALSSDEPANAPTRQDLDKFLSGLSQLWRQGEARPTHSPRPMPKRHWRTRADPFTDVWTEILGWLQEAPEVDATEILARLQSRYPGAFSDGQKRTLQRRLKEWRRVLARTFVFQSPENPSEGEPTMMVAPLQMPS